MTNTTRKQLIRQIADGVHKLLIEYLNAKECFISQLKVYNDAWKKHWKSLLDDKFPPVIDKKPEKSKKDFYEYDRKFKCYFLKDETKSKSDPSQWELADKYSSYYAYLAVVYDLEKGKDAPFKLCEGILDKVAIWFIKHYTYDVWIYEKVDERLHMALDWVTADIQGRPAGGDVIPIKLDDFSNTPSRKLLLDLLDDRSRKGVVLDEARHGKDQPKALRKVLKDKGLEQVASEIHKKKNNVKLDIPINKICIK